MIHETIYTNKYELIVSDSEPINNGDWIFREFNGKVEKYISYCNYGSMEWLKKVIAHRPLKYAPMLEGVSLINEGGNK
jgi:hypothetical protein